MSGEFLIAIEGLDKFADATGDLPVQVQTSLTRAINKTLDRTRTRAARAVLEQVAFPASYLSPSAKRLWVRARARNDSLFGIIEGRGQATSLARFAKNKTITRGSQRPKGGGVAVRMKAGGAYHTLPRAFIFGLRSGNIGLAMRTNGAAPPNAFKPKELGKNLWLLYGASVDQALQAASDGDGVYDDLSDEALEFLNFEFDRQMDLQEKTND